MLLKSDELHGSGVRQTRGEDLLAPEAAVSNPLLMVVAQDGVERGAVRLDAIGPPVVAQKVTILADPLRQPGDHHGHVVEGHALHVLLGHFVLGLSEPLVDGSHDVGPLKGEFALDPAAMREAARLGLGVSLIALFDVLRELERGDLIRLLPDWYGDAGAVSLYYASRTLIAAKTRVFVDFVVNAFKSERLEHFNP